MHIATMPATTPARSHNNFISLQTCFLDMGFPPPATKIEPEAIFRFLAYLAVYSTASAARGSGGSFISA
jgi:hypothetical protein